MKWKLACVIAGVCAFGVAACSKTVSSPASPSAAPAVNANANPDGSTLKVTAPTPQSPINGQRLEQSDNITLTIANGTPMFAVGVAIAYRFQVFNGAGAMVAEGGNVAQGPSTTSFVITAPLEADQTYSWQARVEVQGESGPWSSRATFVTPQNSGYMRGNELYDPLINGQTVGQMHGPLTFIPGVGLRFHSQLSHVSYLLPQTLTEGEFSILVTGMDANTEGDKTKLFAMGQNYDDIVTNERRMTVEKRGDPAGVVAWRFITHDDQVDTEGVERQFVDFKASRTYFWQATWRANRFGLIIREGGADGLMIYNKSKSFKGRAYDPNPHVIYLGSPVGRSGESGASVDNVTIRQVWVSGRPRPAIANK